MKTIEEKAQDYINSQFGVIPDQENHGLTIGHKRAYIAGYEEANKWFTIDELEDNLIDGHILLKDEGDTNNGYEVVEVEDGEISLKHPELFYTHFRYIE